MDGGLALRVAVTARTKVAASDWKAAIRAACDPLVETGAFERRYTQRCIAIVEEQGPYVVLAPGVALAHARPEDGVVSLGLGVACLDGPVWFGHPDNDPVDVVLVFGSPDRDAHVGLLSALARHLVDGLAERLRHAASDDDALHLLEKVVDDAR